MTTKFPALVALLAIAMGLQAKAFDKSIDISGVTLHYKVAQPKDYDAARTYPAVLAFPPGSQGVAARPACDGPL